MLHKVAWACPKPMSWQVEVQRAAQFASFFQLPRCPCYSHVLTLSIRSLIHMSITLLWIAIIHSLLVQPMAQDLTCASYTDPKHGFCCIWIPFFSAHSNHDAAPCNLSISWDCQNMWLCEFCSEHIDWHAFSEPPYKLVSVLYCALPMNPRKSFFLLTDGILGL
jgi:hypothetical protein